MNEAPGGRWLQVGTMRVDACGVSGDVSARRAGRQAAGLATLLIITLAGPSGFAFDGSTQDAPAKISPKNFASAEQALRVGIDDLNAGDAASSIAALTYAAEGGQPIARWKLGQMYADGQGVARDDLKAYHYFSELVEDYDEDAPDLRNRAAISNAFVAVGVYNLNGIPNSEVQPNPQRARDLFQYAATTFGNPDAQYNLANMYIAGAGGLAKEKRMAIGWLNLACSKGHKPAQALLGHMLFIGDGVPPQRPKGLMWLEIARTGADRQEDDWIRDLYDRDLAAASDDDKRKATDLMNERAKGPPLPSFISRSIVKTIEFLRPLNIPMLASSPPPKPAD